jgi:hypothetical protein
LWVLISVSVYLADSSLFLQREKTMNKSHKNSQLDRRKKRDQDIKKEFDKYTQKQHLDADYVVETKLAEKFYLAADTIWNIVKGTGHYKQKQTA